ncbi:hypothetical protein KP509_21G042700 [Ceratopteris richardii]|uniref:xanthine dehydrogenase n=1 Tax=Ceratopteris richardii TaxID=49495 RepID=A0A8T2SC85_CERRI|nr:hypothetical protein KP509_21G042700 [Ceratopteris richardii]
MGSLGGLPAETQPILYVNGKRRVLPLDIAHKTLLEYLRGLGLTGTKLGCGEGGCGACTVMISHFDPSLKTVIHRSMNACLTPIYSVEGMHVITVEGIGNRQKGLHPIQESLASKHGSQCGFCTPGFVMSMYALLRSRKGLPSEEEVEENLSGNLCRCTGYRPILDAFRVFAKTEDFAYTKEASTGKLSNGDLKIQSGTRVCPSTGKPCDCTGISDEQSFEHEKRDPLRADSELIFPPELLQRSPPYLSLYGRDDMLWFRPTNLKDLLSLKCAHPNAKLIVGNTEIGIETRFKKASYPVLISTTHVPELNNITVRDDGIEIGSSVILSRILDVMRSCVQDRHAFETSACAAFIEQLRWFAGAQIRNAASVGGNICTASPISDLNPLWIASRSVFRVINSKGSIRDVPAANFFVGYRKVAMEKSELLYSVFLPWTRKFEYVKEFKQAHRRDDDIALVNAGMRVLFVEVDGVHVVKESSLVYGGVGPVPVCARMTEAFLQNKEWIKETLQGACAMLREDIVIAENAPGGMTEFRSSLVSSFFFKFFLLASYKLEEEGKFIHDFPPSYRSAITVNHKPPSKGCQFYQASETETAVGKPTMHLSAEMQVTGEAEYTDDIPMPPFGLHAALVLSTLPHARIISINASYAENVEGFEGFFTAKDIPGGNDIGAIIADEELFATNVVTCVGQAIGIVVADTLENAKAAAQRVKIEYEELPAILSIEDALKVGSFHPGTERLIQKGDVEACFASGECDHIVEGRVRMGGQEHFYLEPNTSLVWTVDGGNEVFMVSSTQCPQKHQKYVSHVLGIPMNKVVCKTKRIGGGFGGKETKSAFIAAAAAVPAYILKRPVKLTLDRDVDMLITGQRHPFLGKYKVGYTTEGTILALDIELYNNGGNSLDLSHSVLDRAIFHADNVYAVPNLRVFGRVCFTNLASNTAFRGFGGPQGMIIAENWIERIARSLNTSPENIRELNFQPEGYLLHYGQCLEDNTLGRVWSELKESSHFEKRRDLVNAFNNEHKWRKRGISMIPTKFGISFTAKFMNQAGALVQVYTDGTVLVTHGGVEMGQGLHTKVAQIAASSFGIPTSSVFISETSTDKVPNASPTAASASSDIYGQAVLDACDQIKARMQPVRERNSSLSFAQLANACHLERVDLSAHGFYATPDIGFDWAMGRGRPFNYFTFGAACAEVEVDTLTGDSQLLRADIVMDLGRSLNPAIDVGQIEGAFIQGLGWAVLEEVKWGDKEHLWVKPGHLFTQGPGTYKLPTANDIPVEFYVSLLKDAPNIRAIHSSKAVGEPPLFLASSVFFAIKDAIMSARTDHGHHGFFVLDSPATPERIRMACADEFTESFAGPNFQPKLSV